jgi:hypothetical protein
MSAKTKTDYKALGKEIGKAVMGRPLKGTEPLTESFAFRLSEREKQVLMDFAWRHDLSPSDIVRDSLRVLGIIPDW